jgi:hypothetical protein
LRHGAATGAVPSEMVVTHPAGVSAPTGHGYIENLTQGLLVAHNSTQKIDQHRNDSQLVQMKGEGARARARVYERAADDEFEVVPKCCSRPQWSLIAIGINTHPQPRTTARMQLNNSPALHRVPRLPQARTRWRARKFGILVT